MNNTEFSELIRTAFEEKGKYNFVKKTNIVDTTEEEIPESDVQFISADVITDETDKEKKGGSFEFVATNYPHIKSGVRLKDLSDSRLKLTAENLAVGCHVRLNALLALYMCGGGSMGSFDIKINAPEEVHSIATSTSMDTIIEKLKMMEDIHNVKYDRVTLNEVLLTVLTGGLVPAKAKKILKAETGLKVDVDNSHYKQREHDGSLGEYNFVPADRLILSKSKNDKSDIFYFANLPLLDSADVEFSNKHGVQGYIKDDTAWAVLRGIPVLKDSTAFATIAYR